MQSNGENQGMEPFAGLNLDPVSTVDRVAEELRRALFEGEIPPGTPLREQALAESLGVSRPTVREALGVLVGEGLATRAPHRGVVVRTLTAADVADVSAARAILEAAGLSRWRHASDDARDAVRDAVARYRRVSRARPSTAELNEAHLAIHQALTGLTESPRLVAMADALYAEIRLALATVDRTRRNARAQAHSHADLLTLLEEGRLREARTELAAHLADAESSMTELIGDGDATP